MVDLNSYHIIEQIHKGDHLVYRARRLRDDVPVMINCHRTDYPSAADLTRYSREVQNWSGLKTVSDLQTGLRAALAGLRKQI